jgi:hypothetical protein
MLFNNLLETGIIQLGIFSQIVDVGDDVAQIFLQEQKVAIGGVCMLYTSSPGISILPSRLVQAGDDFGDFFLAGLDAAHDLFALDLLEGEDLIQFALEQGDEVFLVFFGPRLAFWFGVFGGGIGFEGGFEGVFEVVIGDVMPVVSLDQGRSQLVSEPREQGLLVSHWISQLKRKGYMATHLIVIAGI